MDGLCLDCGGVLEVWYEYQLQGYDEDYPEGAPLLMERVRCASGHWFDRVARVFEEGDFDA